MGLIRDILPRINLRPHTVPAEGPYQGQLTLEPSSGYASLDSWPSQSQVAPGGSLLGGLLKDSIWCPNDA